MYSHRIKVGSQECTGEVVYLGEEEDNLLSLSDTGLSRSSAHCRLNVLILQKSITIGSTS